MGDEESNAEAIVRGVWHPSCDEWPRSEMNERTIHQKDVLFVDLRTYEQYRSGRVPGALWNGEKDLEDFWQRNPLVAPLRGELVVVLCGAGKTTRLRAMQYIAKARQDSLESVRACVILKTQRNRVPMNARPWRRVHYLEVNLKDEWIEGSRLKPMRERPLPLAKIGEERGEYHWMDGEYFVSNWYTQGMMSLYEVGQVLYCDPKRVFYFRRESRCAFYRMSRRRVQSQEEGGQATAVFAAGGSESHVLGISVALSVIRLGSIRKALDHVMQHSMSKDLRPLSALANLRSEWYYIWASLEADSVPEQRSGYHWAESARTISPKEWAFLCQVHATEREQEGSGTLLFLE